LRSSLADSCLEFYAGHCRSAAAGNVESAQGLANRVETLENLRWVAAAGALVGLTATAVGLVNVVGAGDSGHALNASLLASAQGVSLEWRGRF
jgi:hypothetical protein